MRKCFCDWVEEWLSPADVEMLGESIITCDGGSQDLNWPTLWVYDISVSFIAGFDMISSISAPYTGYTHSMEMRQILSPTLLGWPPQVLNFSSTIHLFTQLCLNQFNWKIINHRQVYWKSLKQNQIQFMFRIIKIPPAVDVKVVQSKNRYFFSEGSLIYLVGHHLERSLVTGQAGPLQI